MSYKIIYHPSDDLFDSSTYLDLDTTILKSDDKYVNVTKLFNEYNLKTLTL